MIDLSHLPPVSAIYRVVHQNRVIYVGQTTDLKQRWRNHHIHVVLIERYGNDWEIDWVEISEINLDRAEAFAHRLFQPELNQANPSRLIGA